MRAFALLLPLLPVLAACSAEDAPVASSPTPPPVSTSAARGTLVIVLPPDDGLAASERDRLRIVVGRALDASLPPGVDPASVRLLAPVDRTVLVDTVERAVRRAGDDGTVCVLGAGMRERIDPVLALYPSARVCLLPVLLDAGDATNARAVDVDLEDVGRRLGEAARLAAADGSVLVLDGDDPMLDRRWRSGVTAGVMGTADARDPVRVHTIRSAEGALRILDEQATLLEAGIVPGSPEAFAANDGSGAGDGEGLRPAIELPPVRVVVLDASREAEALIGPLVERGLLVVAPRSVLVAAGVPDEAVVLRWRIRWDVPLAALVRSLGAGDPAQPSIDDVLILDPGPAAVTP